MQHYFPGTASDVIGLLGWAGPGQSWSVPVLPFSNESLVHICLAWLRSGRTHCFRLSAWSVVALDSCRAYLLGSWANPDLAQYLSSAETKLLTAGNQLSLANSRSLCQLSPAISEGIDPLRFPLWHWQFGYKSCAGSMEHWSTSWPDAAWQGSNPYSQLSWRCWDAFSRCLSSIFKLWCHAAQNHGSVRGEESKREPPPLREKSPRPVLADSVGEMRQCGEQSCEGVLTTALSRLVTPFVSPFWNTIRLGICLVYFRKLFALGIRKCLLCRGGFGVATSVLCTLPPGEGTGKARAETLAVHIVCKVWNKKPCIVEQHCSTPCRRASLFLLGFKKQSIGLGVLDLCITVSPNIYVYSCKLNY